MPRRPRPAARLIGYPIPTWSLSGAAFRGRKWKKSTESVYAFREERSFGEIYSSKFDRRQMKAPLVEAARGAGWGWHVIAFDKL